MTNEISNPNVYQEKKSSKLPLILKKTGIYILLVVWAIVVIFPFYWMILTSLKSFSMYATEQTSFITTDFLNPPYFESYITACTTVSMFEYLCNTVVFSVVTTFIMLIITVLAAFAFARLEFVGKNIVFTIFLAMMMIPNELMIITNYVTILRCDLYDTFTAMVLPSCLSVFYIYLLRQNFMQVPDSMYYAAKIDGLSDFGYMTKILVPLSKPTIVTIIILKLIECWNSYVWPRLVTSSTGGKSLVSTAIETIRITGFGRSNYPAMMAAVVVISFPLLILFILFRNQIMSGVSRTGTKG